MPRPPAIDQSARASSRVVSPTTSLPESFAEFDDTIVTGEAVALDLRTASFVLRGAGAMIDWLTYFGLYVLGILLLLPVLIDSLQLDDALVAAVAIALLVVAIVVAPITVELLTRGKSLGKLAVGARIVRDDGGAIGFRHAFIRALTGVLEIYLTFGGIAIAVSLLNSRSKRLGDLLAGTYSQYERVSRVVKPVYGVPVQLAQWALTADVARMPDRLSRRISQYLAQAGQLTPDTRVRVARDLAIEVSPFVSPLPAVDPELFLAGVAAVRRERDFTALQLEARGLERLAPVLTGLPNGFPER
ncbi:putative RDD family membrane protein YckC [Conyzicola nivalis]|uniref:RDD family membrane protein YckC n=1 Tax=Conyzicola nivalis TaxID=1477021 RepID=A0ABV2QR00_9MICO